MIQGHYLCPWNATKLSREELAGVAVVAPATDVYVALNMSDICP